MNLRWYRARQQVWSICLPSFNRFTEVINSFWSWVRILLPIKIWFSTGSTSPIYSVTGCAIPITWELFIPIQQWHVTLEIGDESKNRTWSLMSSVILIQLKKLFIVVGIQLLSQYLQCMSYHSYILVIIIFFLAFLPSRRVSHALLLQPMGLGCSSPCILHTFQSVNPSHWQWPAPMGSWRVTYWLEKLEQVHISLLSS